MDSRAPNEPRIGREPYRQGTGLFGGHFALGPFLPRDAMCCHRVSVCPSARLSQAGILSKPLSTESRNEKARNPDLENFTKFLPFFRRKFHRTSVLAGDGRAELAAYSHETERETAVNAQSQVDSTVPRLSTQPRQIGTVPRPQHTRQRNRRWICFYTVLPANVRRSAML